MPNKPKKHEVEAAINAVDVSLNNNNTNTLLPGDLHVILDVLLIYRTALNAEESKKANMARKNNVPYNTFRHPVCRGSLALGSGCGTCEKCEWERRNA